MTLRQTDDSEQEARRKRRFLEEGAEVSLAPVLDYAPATARLAATRPVTVPLPDTAELAERLVAEEEAEAVVTVDFGHLPTRPDFSVVVYLGTRQDPAAFLGTVAFFLHPGEHADHDPVRARLPARRAIERTGVAGPISVTCVPLQTGNRDPSGDLDITVSVELVRSEIR